MMQKFVQYMFTGTNSYGDARKFEDLLEVNSIDYDFISAAPSKNILVVPKGWEAKADALYESMGKSTI